MLRQYQIVKICAEIDLEIKPHFRGVFGADQIEMALAKIDRNQKNFLIFNSDPSYKPGARWLGVFVDLEKESYFIDPQNRHPNFYNLEKFWQLATDSDFLTVGRQLESKFSNLSGIYAIFFGHFLCKGYGMGKIMNLLDQPSKILRDRHVLDWFEKNYGKKITINVPLPDCSEKKSQQQSCKSYRKMLIDRKTY
jgi:hypothetical protein